MARHRSRSVFGSCLVAGLVACTSLPQGRAVAATATVAPSVDYATYLRPLAFGAGDGFQNHGLAIAADADGNAYVAGIVESSSFPVTAGAYRTTRPGGRDIFVAKINPAGSALVWATYLGGSGTEVENGQSLGIAVDADGNVYVAGSTSSADFPTTAGAYQTSLHGTTDAFVSKLSADGSTLLYSTLVGGDGIDYGWGVAVDGDGHAYVCGETNGGFPTTPGAFHTDSQFGSAFLAKIDDDGGALVFSTTLGTNTGKARAVALDQSGNAFVTGSCDSPHGGTSYPVTEGAYQTTGKGSFDAFVSKVRSDGAELLYSTYLGGDANEGGTAIAVDGAGNAYVTGTTSSANFPTSAGAFQTTLQSTPTPDDDAFVTRVNPGGSGLVFSTYLGGAAGESPTGIAIDGSGAAIVAGSTFSTNFPTTAGAFQETIEPALGSAYVAKVAANGKSLGYSTLIHPTSGGQLSIAYAIALDTKGGAYMAGTSGATFPTTSGAFQTTGVFASFGGPVAAKLSGVAAAAAAAVCGDFNGDGRLTASDALGTLRVAVGLGTCGLSVCDYTGDGKLTAADALSTLRAAVGGQGAPHCPAA